MKSKNSPEKLLRQILELDALEFLGICKIIGVKVYEEDSVEKTVEVDSESGQAKEVANVTMAPRDFYDIWDDVCDTVEGMNRTRRRNLGRLIYSATKKEKEK